MPKRMLIDATQTEETRVAVVDGQRLEEFDYESAMRKPLRGNIYLAKVTRVEPSLQAAFVSYGGNRHGFLPFSEIHPDYFRIPVADQEEFERMQREQLEEHDKREACDADGLTGDDDASGSDNGAQVIEIVDADDAPYDNTDTSDPTDTKDQADDRSDAQGPGDDSSIDAASADTPDADTQDASVEDGDDASAEANEDETDDGENKGQGRRRRGGRYGRGRSGGRKRSNFRSRRPENFSDDEAGQAQRFRFNLRRKYKIQEVIKRGQIMLIQVSREERGNKGAAVSSYLSLPGRYCVLMPNSPRGGGVSRKISNQTDRSKMKDLLGALEVPAGMSTIVRTAGVTRTKAEVKRDLDYLMRLWNSIRELTLKSTAPALVYEEADLIKRSVRDQYTRDIEEVLVAGADGHKNAKAFMKMLMPSHAKRIKLYEDTDVSLFQRYGVEQKIAEIGETEVTLPSGGYLVINPTEALVSIDVNSGRATKERNIEGTALRTNLEAAEEVARQLRLRDLGGLVVIDFIDMEDRRNNGKVERKMRDALSSDRARVQVGRISSFGLMELSRQRLNASLSEAQFEVCPHCEGRGRVRTADSASLLVLRAIEAEGVRMRASQVIAHVPANVALYLLNYKRALISDLEGRYGLEILIRVEDSLPASAHRVEVSRPRTTADENQGETADESNPTADTDTPSSEDENSGRKRSRRRGNRGGRDRNRRKEQTDISSPEEETQDTPEDTVSASTPDAPTVKAEEAPDTQDTAQTPKRRRRKSPAKDKDSSTDSANSGTEDANTAEPEAHKSDAADKAEKKTAKKPVKKRSKPKDTADEKNSDTAAAKTPASDDVPKDDAPQDNTPQTDDSSHEVVNKAPKKKRLGWWNKK